MTNHLIVSPSADQRYQGFLRNFENSNGKFYLSPITFIHRERMKVLD